MAKEKENQGQGNNPSPDPILTDEEILAKGIAEGYSKKLIDQIKSPLYIIRAGNLWSGFNQEYALSILADKKMTGFILLSAKEWDNFNYVKGLQAIRDSSDDKYWLFRAKYEWPITKQQKNAIEAEDTTGYWAYMDLKLGKITKEEAKAKPSNSKWAEKIEEHEEKKNESKKTVE
jgi:hypothetical protein